MCIKKRINRWGKERIPFVFLIDFELKKPLLYPLSDCPKELKYNFDGKSNYHFTKNSITVPNLKAESVDFYRFKKKFDQSQKYLNRGDTYLINLTDKSHIQSNLNFEELFVASNSKYTIWLKDEFISFSPETFVTIKKDIISTYPMKGTIEHRGDYSKKELIDNLKEQSEHATVVDLLRNDLSRVSKKVTVEKYRYYEVLHTSEKPIGQISSKIIGHLDKDYHSRLGDILFNLLPAGSICGAPKDKTVHLIGEIEEEPRGYYTGVAFYFDGKDLDSCVMIRYIDKENNFRSGGGITSMSILEDEYQELKNKVYVPIV